jgi:hypothetical protein
MEQGIKSKFRSGWARKDAGFVGSEADTISGVSLDKG